VTGSARRPPSDRSAIEPFHVMEVMREAARREAAGEQILHLEVGQPSTPAPEGVLAAASRALHDDRLGYTPALGLDPLRDRIARWYRERYDVEVDRERVVVTTGASGSCVLAFLACWDPGDRVAVLEPGYPCYRNDLVAFGVEVVGVPVGPETGFRPTIELLESVGPLDGLVLASPSNPTGTVLDAAVLADVLGWAAARGVRTVVDEIYHGITYGEPAPTALAHDPDAVVINSFSKYFSMTGWRLGWIVAPAELLTPLERLGQNLAIAAPTLSQRAGIAAFDCIDELEANVARYAANRAVLLEGLPAVGLGAVAPPDGAFYLYADARPLGIPATELCRRWLHEVGVAVTPGIDFDPRRGDDWVRFSYAGAGAELAEAMDRLAGWAARR
jgi:aspartate/methionine/tyrosine aminotransferase